MTEPLVTPKSCMVARCATDVRQGRYCEAHAARNRRLGSPTARKCYRCKFVFDNETTAEMTGQGAWLCDGCLLKPSRFRKPGKWHKAGFDLTREQVYWLGSQSVRLNVRPSELLRDVIDRLMLPGVFDRIWSHRRGVIVERGERERMPNPARAMRYRCKLGGHGFYVDANVYDDDRVGAVFVDLGKVGSPLNAIFKSWCVSVSKALQFGVPLVEVIESFEPQEKELPVGPCGFLQCEEVADLHGRTYPHVWAVVVALLKHEVDEQGRLRCLIGVETRSSRRREQEGGK